ncbi:hypothetical protein LGM80_19380 [Burkholderia multivorans]|uniref:Uncharacterized protein n=1 Tax=Burkholderia multivorans TaxID=87883 RepID=A0A2S9MHQ9_9BURK|nr:hypothetical protein [Burkholderia multivorans]MBU9146679.1 hypothetical protein [Burkholderia multivorans]MBU9513404.1 hypothetical protein [Burkholderia multivorans]MBU9528434.1 hypothetical protein [Burkholderia multivorans]MBU9540071.1 hypothetical protein [Burkholderia multivorans]MBU9637525.1 hypothetical protein [Burkholderia multivorans]
MNRDQVLSVLPSDAEFQAAPNYGKKQFVERFISAALDQLDVEQREPDRWEGEQLTQAIGYLLVDWYGAAITATEKALAPTNERADPDSWARTEHTVTKRALREGLDYLAGKPAKNG